MERGGRQAAQSFRQLIGSDTPHFCRRFTAQQFCQQGGARHRSDASARPESSFHDAPGLHAGREFKDVAADRVFNRNCGRRGVKCSHVARILEMVEDGFAVHLWSIARARPKFNVRRRGIPRLARNDGDRDCCLPAFLPTMRASSSSAAPLRFSRVRFFGLAIRFVSLIDSDQPRSAPK
jgi:hypothetical protein